MEGWRKGGGREGGILYTFRASLKYSVEYYQQMWVKTTVGHAFN